MTVAHPQSRSRPALQNSLKWWQWILMYPAFGVALLGAIPTAVQVYRAFWYDTSYAEVPMALRNQKLTEENLPCLQKSGTSLQLADNTMIQAAVCEKGDIWILSTTSDNRAHLSWVARDEVLGKKESGLLTGAAWASPGQLLAQNDARPLCVFKDRSGKIIRRLVVGQGVCQDQQIDPFTGRINVVPAPCACPPNASQ